MLSLTEAHLAAYTVATRSSCRATELTSGPRAKGVPWRIGRNRHIPSGCAGSRGRAPPESGVAIGLLRQHLKCRKRMHASSPSLRARALAQGEQMFALGDQRTMITGRPLNVLGRAPYMAISISA